jgi:hypothetical protein
MGLTPPGALLMCASAMIIPVQEAAPRVVPPRPRVKLEERRYVEPVWAVDLQKHLTLQNGGLELFCSQVEARVMSSTPTSFICPFGDGS